MRQREYAVQDGRDEMVAPVVLFLGYSVYMAVMLDGYITDFGAVSDFVGYVSNIPFMLAASLGIALAAALVFLLRRRKPAPFTLPHIIPSFGMALGYVLGQFADPASTGMLVLMGLVWGISTGTLTVAFLEMIANHGSPTLVILQLASGAFFSGVLLMAMEGTPQGAGLMVRLLLIAAFCATVHIGRKMLQSMQQPNMELDSRGRPSWTACRAALNQASTPIVAYVFFDAAIGLVNIYAYLTGEEIVAVAPAAPMWGMLVCAGLLIGFVAFSNRIGSTDAMTLIVFPFAIGVLLLLPFLNERVGHWISAVLYGANTFTSTMSIYCCIMACRKTGADTCLVVAAVRLIARITLLVGLALGGLLASVPGGEPTVRLFMATAVCVYLLLVVIVYWAARHAKAKPGTQPEAPDRTTTETQGCAAAAVEVEPHDEMSSRMDWLAQEHGLSAREREVYELLLQGGTAKSMAQQLGLSPNTVQGYVQKLYAKLGINKKDRAVALFNEPREQPCNENVAH